MHRGQWLPSLALLPEAKGGQRPSLLGLGVMSVDEEATVRAKGLFWESWACGFAWGAEADRCFPASNLVRLIEGLWWLEAAESLAAGVCV